MVDAEELARRLRTALTRRLGGVVEVGALDRLTGGASRETWALEATVDGAARSWILQRERPGGLRTGTGMAGEAALLAAAGAAGSERSRPLTRAERRLLARYVEAFERCDVQALTSLIHEDANRSVRRERHQGAESVRSASRVRPAAPTVAA